jgi:hypothetical protein
MPNRSHNAAAAIAITIALALVQAAETTQSAIRRSYVAPPMHLEVWPLRHGAEFTPMELADTFYSGQTLVLHITLRNQWAEYVQVTPDASSGRWQDGLQLRLERSDGTVASGVIGPIDTEPRARIRQRGDVAPRGDAYAFGPDAEQVLELRFATGPANGDYVLSVRLPLDVVPDSADPVRQILEARRPLRITTPRSRPERLEVLYREAVLARVDQRLTATREHLEQLLHVSPNSSAGLMLMGDVALKTGGNGEARSLYVAALQALARGADRDSVAIRGPRLSRRMRVLESKISELEPRD